MGLGYCQLVLLPPGCEAGTDVLELWSRNGNWRQGRQRGIDFETNVIFFGDYVLGGEYTLDVVKVAVTKG